MNEYTLDPRVYDSDEFTKLISTNMENAQYIIQAGRNDVTDLIMFQGGYYYDLIKLFMLKAGQEVHDVPAMPSDETIELRARLIMEEALETIAALGCKVYLDCGYVTVTDGLGMMKTIEVNPSEVVKVRSTKYANVDLVEIVDGCCDVMYVTLGTLISFGIQDCEYFDEVCYNNLSKVYPNCVKVDGKVQKPADYKPPRIKQMLENLFAVCKEYNLKDITPSLFNKPNE